MALLTARWRQKLVKAWTVQSRVSYYADFVLFPGQAFLLWLWATSFSWWLFMAGVLFWSFAEYVLHRWVFHGPLASLHQAHHYDPTAYVGVSSWPTLIVTQGCFWGLLWAGHADFLSGFLAGYTWYITIHVLVHTPRFSVFMKRYHDRHHQPFARGNYGVSHPLWDIVLGTTITKD